MRGTALGLALAESPVLLLRVRFVRWLANRLERCQRTFPCFIAHRFYFVTKATMWDIEHTAD
ncbi:MAG: hypothetical protein CFE44_09215 [Burkholderiales bacterium PBB4]|nr:MAG: hypothetical protein CFE44_09215 [Burkholderiales bacterium PBB4]